MQRFPSCFGWILLFAVSVSGCSSLSEWYACGVNCQYYPRPPLPYQQYEEGVCHSHVVDLPRKISRSATDEPNQEGTRDPDKKENTRQD